jgi:head-tail adaptor
MMNIYKKSGSRLLSAETRWRVCEEAFAAAAGPKRREALATGARQKKSGSRLLSAETRWRDCEEALAAAAGPKRREALATGARQKKSGSRLLSAETSKTLCRILYYFIVK